MLAGTVGKEGDGLFGMGVGLLGVQELFHVARTPGNPQQTRLVIEEMLEPLGVVALFREEIKQDPRIQITAAGPHHQSPRGGQPHGGILTATMGKGGHAGTITQMGNNGGGLTPIGELALDEFVGKTMKSILAHTFVPKMAG